MPRNKSKYAKRVFLNEDPSMSAFVIAIVPPSEGDGSVYPTFDIGDCTNKVSLDFGFWNKRAANNSLKKVRLFRTVVNEFADAFEKLVEERNKTGNTNGE